MENFIDDRIPVTIITGFLGAGKTSLLNSLISTNKEKKFAIIENEFGEINIDSDLIIGVEDSIFELSNGCICCSLNDDFQQVIYRLLESPFSFNHLLVETTGIADPLAVVKSFFEGNNIQFLFRVDSVVCVVDVENVEELIKQYSEIRKQIALADTIIINKTDLVGEKYLSEMEKFIRSLSPMARIYKTSFSNIENFELLDLDDYQIGRIEKSVNEFMENDHYHHHRHDIVSEGFVFNRPFDMDKFSLWIHNYLYFNKSNILRMKGVVRFKNMHQRYILHAVRGSYMMDEGAPWNHDEKESKLVFIGKKIERQELEASLKQLLV